jgi:RNase P subunit RPR2
MKDEESKKTIEYLIEIAEILAKENETLRRQNVALAEKVLIMQQLYIEEQSATTLQRELLKAHDDSTKKNQLTWVVTKIGKA